MELLQLPHCMIEHILSFLSYDEIAINRRVCTQFNEIGSQILNRGFVMTGKRHSAFLKKIKAQLPRRESERRSHPLGRQCEILWCIETRISILSTCYSHFSERGLCCFIPGKILDEINNLLTSLQSMNAETIPQANTLLQELRDLCSMAVEHFREKIAPELNIKLKESLKIRGYGEIDDVDRSTPSVAFSLAQIGFKVNHNFRATRKLNLNYHKLRKQMNAYKKLALKQKRQMKTLHKLICGMKRKLKNYESNLSVSKTNLDSTQDSVEDEKPTITKRRHSQVERPITVTPEKRQKVRPITVSGTDIPVLSYIKHIMRKSTDETPTSGKKTGPITKPRNAVVRLPFGPPDERPPNTEHTSTVGYIRHIMRQSTSAF